MGKMENQSKFRDGFIGFIHIARKCYFVNIFFAQKKYCASKIERGAL